jgi:hypothetical protein
MQAAQDCAASQIPIPNSECGLPKAPDTGGASFTRPQVSTAGTYVQERGGTATCEVEQPLLAVTVRGTPGRAPDVRVAVDICLR